MKKLIDNEGVNSEETVSSRRDFLKKAGKFAVYTSPAVMMLMKPSFASKEGQKGSWMGRPRNSWKPQHRTSWKPQHRSSWKSRGHNSSWKSRGHNSWKSDVR